MFLNFKFASRIILGVLLLLPGAYPARAAGSTNRVMTAGELADQEFERAKTLYQINEVPAAADALELLINSYPQSQVVYEATLFLGQIYLTQNQPRKAKQAAEKFLATHDDEQQVKAVKRLVSDAEAKLKPIATPQGLPVAMAATVPPPQTLNPVPPVMPVPVMPLQEPVPEVSNTPVKQTALGLVLPLSGPSAVYGERVLSAVQMALSLPMAKFSGAGPLVQQNDRLSLVVVDSKANASQAALGVETLVKQHNVVAILGDILIDTSHAVAKKANELGVPNLSLSREQGLVALGPLVFRLGLTVAKQTKALVERASQLGVTKYAILYPKHPYGLEMKESFTKEVKAKGAEVKLALAYDPGQTTFTELVEKVVGPQNYGASAAYRECMEEAQAAAGGSFRIKKATEACRSLVAPSVSFQALFVPDFQKPLSYLLPALVSRDVLLSKNERIVNSFRKNKKVPGANPVQLLGPSSWGGPILSERLGVQIDGALFVDGMNLARGEQPGAFAAEFKRVMNADATLIEAQAYDAAQVLRSLVTLPPAEQAVSREAFAAKLLNVRNFKGVTGDISFDQSRDSIVPLHWFVFQEGQVRAEP